MADEPSGRRMYMPYVARKYDTAHSQTLISVEYLTVLLRETGWLRKNEKIQRVAQDEWAPGVVTVYLQRVPHTSTFRGRAKKLVRWIGLRLPRWKRKGDRS